MVATYTIILVTFIVAILLFLNNYHNKHICFVLDPLCYEEKEGYIKSLEFGINKVYGPETIDPILDSRIIPKKIKGRIRQAKTVTLVFHSDPKHITGMSKLVNIIIGQELKSEKFIIVSKNPDLLEAKKAELSLRAEFQPIEDFTVRISKHTLQSMLENAP